ncbi:MAG: AMP-binding protein [Planctomycetes bacterium]|nr:AMP-binding protein [Planctomycetota bacterium]
MNNKNYVWEPSKDYIEKTNIYRFMKKHRINTVDELIVRSHEQMEWFWDEVIKDLNIHFFKPYKKVMDSSEGIPWTKWFTGGKTNIAYNCIEKWAASNQASKYAVIWEGEDGKVVKLTYLLFNEYVNRVANFLIESGIGKGDRVGLFMPMIPEAIIATFAVLKVGAIYVPIFSGYGPDAVATRLQDAEAKLLFTCNGFFRKGKEVVIQNVALEAMSRTPSVQRLVIVDRLPLTAVNQKKVIRWDDIIAKGNSNFNAIEMDSEDPFMIIYTSGTTGRPKGAVHVHGGFMVKIAEEVAYQTDLRDEDILFWFTDMGWIMAPWELVGGLTLGGTIFCYEGIPDHPNPDRLWDMIQRHRITTLGISPTAIRALRKYPDKWVTDHDLSSLRILGSTGEAWNDDPYKWFFEKVGGSRCPIINLSGGTEVGACFLSPHPISPLKPCTLKGPSLGMDVDVFNEAGQSVRNEVGELVCKKPWPGMTRGIWKDSQRFIDVYWSRWKDIWLHGDWASVDGDGFWFLHGRSDDTIKVAGKRIGPAEIESIVTKHPDVLEAAAIGIPDQLKGESIVCFVVAKDPSKKSDSVKLQINDLIIRELGKTMQAKEIRFVSMLPKTRNAKVLRRLMRNKFIGKPLGDTSTLENPRALDEI